jgi:hypothetical protein
MTGKGPLRAIVTPDPPTMRGRFVLLETRARSPSGQPAETVVAVEVGDDVNVRDSSMIGMG